MRQILPEKGVQYVCDTSCLTDEVSMQCEMRKIIKIDEELCNGCGLCVDACHEGAIALVDGKAKLMFENYCDGLGDCLPACPTGAISFEVREAPAYDEAAVLAAQKAAQEKAQSKDAKLPCGCPGSMSKTLEKSGRISVQEKQENTAKAQSELTQWPVQMKLVPTNAPYFQGCDLLIAADCTAYAYGSFHQDFMAGKVTIVGCPKLDDTDYAEKLSQIIAQNDIRSITLTRMQVPCCGGLEAMLGRAVEASGKDIPVSVVTISLDGAILN